MLNNFTEIVIGSISGGLGLGLLVYFSGYSLSQIIHFFKALTK